MPSRLWYYDDLHIDGVLSILASPGNLQSSWCKLRLLVRTLLYCNMVRQTTCLGLWNRFQWLVTRWRCIPNHAVSALASIGFGWSLRISGFIILALLVIANLTVRSRIRNVPRPVKLSDYTSPFSEVPFVLLMLASCCGFFAMFVPISYIVIEAQEDGVNPDLAGYLLTILNAARLVLLSILYYNEKTMVELTYSAVSLVEFYQAT